MESDAHLLKQPTLAGPRVVLLPLAMSHQGALLSAAGDGELWNLKVTVVPGPNTMDDYIAAALTGRAAGTVMPFSVALKEGHRIVGSTRYWKIDRMNRSLEIGHTWLAASFQRSFVNTEAKYLLLRYAFEVLEVVRVQFTTDELNERSRAALLRIGATLEGVIRHERIMPDGRKRNSALFSIIETEWPLVREALECKVGAQPGSRIFNVTEVR
jgi:RimJ/RimL family protein N-acetyltransferase